MAANPFWHVDPKEGVRDGDEKVEGNDLAAESVDSEEGLILDRGFLASVRRYIGRAKSQFKINTKKIVFVSPFMLNGPTSKLWLAFALSIIF